MHKYSLLLFLLATVSHSLQAQADARYPEEQPIFPFGQIMELDSKALQEKRTLNIYLPQDYHPDSAQTYPTIYVLDGSAHEDFPHIAGLAQFMNMYELLPKSIVVGIANVDRYRDFSHPSKDSLDLHHLPTSGGSAQFMNFVELELQPFIDRMYRTNGHTTIIGQSMGGLLATEVLFKRPHLFKNYIIVSPSLWWDQQSMIAQADHYLKDLPNEDRKVYVSLGKEHPVMHEVADKLIAAIKKADHPKLTLWYEPILDEDHATILHLAVYQAFKALHKKEKEDH